MEFTGKVHESNLSKVEAEVVKLNKRARKLGMDLLTFEIVGKEINEDNYPIVDVFYNVKIVGTPPVIDGWRLVAVLNHLKESNIVRVVPGETLPEKYRTEPQLCEHCGIRRFRKDTFVVINEDGTYKQVGSACVADFLGHKNPKAFLEAARWPEAFENVFKTYGGMPTDYYTNYSLKFFLGMVVASIEQFGWISSAKAREEYTEATWSKTVSEIELGPKSTVKMTDKNYNTAVAAIEWVKNLNPKSDYEHNIKAVVNNEMVNSKTYAIAASIIPVFKRATEPKREFKVSNFVGNIKEKVKVTVTWLNTYSFENHYKFSRWDSDTFYVHRFVDDNGNIIIWKNTSNPGFERDEKVILAGTVKSHDEYKGNKQTTLTRVKVQ